MKTVFVSRGAAGAGKSTRVRRMADAFRREGRSVAVCSSDDFFVCPGCAGYHWSRDKLHYAHQWCQSKFRAALAAGTEAVFVDNTCITVKECRPYVEWALDSGYSVEFLEPTTPWAFDVDELTKRNVHGVPREGIQRMLERWAPDMTVDKALGLDQPGVPTPDEEAASPSLGAIAP